MVEEGGGAGAGEGKILSLSCVWATPSLAAHRHRLQLEHLGWAPAYTLHLHRECVSDESQLCAALPPLSLRASLHSPAA